LGTVTSNECLPLIFTVSWGELVVATLACGAPIAVAALLASSAPLAAAANRNDLDLLFIRVLSPKAT
jgi:hypothetical protein